MPRIPIVSLRVGFEDEQIAGFALEGPADRFKGFEIKSFGAIPQPGRCSGMYSHRLLQLIGGCNTPFFRDLSYSELYHQWPNERSWEIQPDPLTNSIFDDSIIEDIKVASARGRGDAPKPEPIEAPPLAVFGVLSRKSKWAAKVMRAMSARRRSRKERGEGSARLGGAKPH